MCYPKYGRLRKERTVLCMHVYMVGDDVDDEEGIWRGNP